jgi:hypothetical protein
MRNITVGDIPFDSRGDFYLSIECSTNPPMVTAIQEEKLPKVVHFPEILCLKVKDSFLEPRVRVVVKELNVLGSVELCEVYLSASSICSWGNDPPTARMKRFQMRPLDSGVERITPAWLLVEFCQADDVRGIEHDKHLAVNGMVRTWVPVTDDSVRASGSIPIGIADRNQGTQPTAMSTAWGGAQNSKWRKDPRMNVDLAMGKFKGFYTLLDDSGNPVQEPDEHNLGKYRAMRMCAQSVFGCSQCLVISAFLFWLFFRLYVFSCYRHFKWMTIANQTIAPTAFPISIETLETVVQECHKDFDGTGTVGGRCRPSEAEVLQICQVGGLPPKQPRPEAYTLVAHQVFGINRGDKTIFGEWNGVGCFKEGDQMHLPFLPNLTFGDHRWPMGVCEFRDQINPKGWTLPLDFWTVMGFVVLYLSTFCLRCCLNGCLRSTKRGDQKMDNEKIARLKRPLAQATLQPAAQNPAMVRH